MNETEIEETTENTMDNKRTTKNMLSKLNKQKNNILDEIDKYYSMRECTAA